MVSFAAEAQVIRASRYSPHLRSESNESTASSTKSSDGDGVVDGPLKPLMKRPHPTPYPVRPPAPALLEPA
ncbi:MAG: hypothetical protein INR71_15035 [Terriglobus roseus]|nr:hypothetical protein [Terriglobus roseus]